MMETSQYRKKHLELSKAGRYRIYRISNFSVISSYSLENGNVESHFILAITLRTILASFWRCGN